MMFILFVPPQWLETIASHQRPKAQFAAAAAAQPLLP
jgi:hypothetical protein